MSIKISPALPAQDSFEFNLSKKDRDADEANLDTALTLLQTALQEPLLTQDNFDFSNGPIKRKDIAPEELPDGLAIDSDSSEKIDIGLCPMPALSPANSIENLRKLPLMERLLAHLSVIIPLLREIEKTERTLEEDRMNILKNHMNEEIGSNNVSGALSLFGNLGAAALGLFAGQGAAQIGSTLVGAVDTLNRSNMIYDQKEFQLNQSELDNIKKTLQQAESLRQRLLDAIQRTDQAFILRG